MSSLLAVSLNAQTKIDDLYIVPPRATFVNQSDSTYFAVPRYRLERLLRDAMISDSLAVQWQATLDQLAQRERSLFFWRTVAIVGTTAFLVTLLADLPPK